jgi:hypothetical protein
VRRHLEREGANGGGDCRGRQQLQGKVAAGEAGAVEGAGQGAKPSATGGEGGSRGRHLVAAAAQWSLDVRGGQETLDLWRRPLWRSSHEAVALGNPIAV